MRLNKYLILAVMLILGAGIGYGLRGNNDDFKIATMGDNGVVLRSISSQRRMVNTLVVGKEVPMWIPRGLGWYQSGKIGKLLKQENKQNLLDEIFFYNFGFVPDVVVMGEDENWLLNTQIIQKWGVGNYLKYRINSANMMVNSENIDTDLQKSEEALSEIIQRDFADSRLLPEDLRISVYNNSLVSGVAAMISRNLEWAGMTVVGIENYQGKIDDCKIVRGKEAGTTYGYKILHKLFSSCSEEESQTLGKMEAELYLGDKFVQMLNYQSYRNN